MVLFISFYLCAPDKYSRERLNMAEKLMLLKPVYDGATNNKDMLNYIFGLFQSLFVLKTILCFNTKSYWKYEIQKYNLT